MVSRVNKSFMLSAVVLAYNRRDEVLYTIAKLKVYLQTLPFLSEIIVVDNASTDDTSLKLKQTHPDIVLITKVKNNGIAGWNDGFAAAKYKYLLVLDDDSHPESGIAESVDYLEAHFDTGILALNVTTGPYLTDTWVWPNGSPWQHEQEVLGFFGCGAIIKKEVYDKIGGFAEWMLVYGHEWDYGIRCIDAGYKVRYFKNSSINHRASATNRSLKRVRTFSTRNDMGMAYKYLGENRWRYILIMFGNNLKRVKFEGLASAFYDILGFIEFLKFRKSIPYTPVSPAVQRFFVANYNNTHPVFGFINKLFKQKKVAG